MLYALALIISMISFSLSLSERTYSLTNFNKINITFSQKEQYAILEFYHRYESYFLDSTFSISFTQNEFVPISVYLYKVKSKIEKDYFGDFINYLESDTLTEQRSIYIPKDHKLTSGYYYIAIKCPTSKEIDTYINAYSAGRTYNILQNVFNTEIGYDSKNTYFNFSVYQTKYMKIGYKHLNGYGSNSFYLTDSNKKIILQKKNADDFEKKIDLREYATSYGYFYINIELKQNDNSYNSFLFYILAGDYPIVPLTINTKTFQEFMIFSDIDLLLDVSNFKKNDKLILEYSVDWKYETIIAQGYDISDPEQIYKTTGRELDLTLDYSHSDSKTCKRYFTIDNNNLKKVLLKVKKPTDKDYVYNFQIRYEKEAERTNTNDPYYPYYPTDINPYSSTDISVDDLIEMKFFICAVWNLLIAAIASVPNVLVFYCSDKNKKIISFCPLVLNILMHIGLGGIFYKAFKPNANEVLHIIDIVLILIIMIPTIIVLIYSFKKNKQYSLFKSFDILYPKNKDLMTLQESINFYKKFPPVINIEGKGKVEESREIWERFNNYIERRIETGWDGFKEMNYYNMSEKTHEYRSVWDRTKLGGGKMDKEVEHLRNECYRSVETRIRENYNKTIEFEYGSWEDATKIDNSIFNTNAYIVQIQYNMNLDYSEEAKKDIEEIKNQLKDEMRDICDIINANENIRCPNAEGYGLFCFVNEDKKNKSFSGNVYILVIWFISFFFGYTSITDLCFINKKNPIITIELIKKVSGKNEKIYRANYNENDGPSDYPQSNQLNVSNNNINNNVDDKNQMLISLKDQY